MKKNNKDLMAQEKLKEEITLYRNKLFGLKSIVVYKQYMSIMLMEATYHYTIELLQSNNSITMKILENDNTLEECTKLVIEKAREIGRLGSLMLDDYYSIILDYYKLESVVVKSEVTN